MASLVLQLQAQALDSSVPIGDLLRKALLVAKKLDIPDFQQWIEHELDGYEDVSVPKYRHISGDPSAWNPYHGWIPVIMNNEKDAELIRTMPIAQRITELERFATETPDKSLVVTYSPRVQKWLMDGMNTNLRPVLRISTAHVQGIIEAVRTTVLNWAIKLEKDGILGEDLIFTPEEAVIAKQANYSITNYIGSMTNSNIQQASSVSSQQIELALDRIPDLMDFLTELVLLQATGA